MDYQEWLASISTAVIRLRGVLDAASEDKRESIVADLQRVDADIWAILEWAEEA